MRFGSSDPVPAAKIAAKSAFKRWGTVEDLVGATVFLPPTLIASIANFKYLPALPAPWGYPIALIVLLGSAVVPYLWFRRRGWL